MTYHITVDLLIFLFQNLIMISQGSLNQHILGEAAMMVIGLESFLLRINSRGILLLQGQQIQQISPQLLVHMMYPIMVVMMFLLLN